MIESWLSERVREEHRCVEASAAPGDDSLSPSRSLAARQTKDPRKVRSGRSSKGCLSRPLGG